MKKHLVHRNDCIEQNGSSSARTTHIVLLTVTFYHSMNCMCVVLSYPLHHLPIPAIGISLSPLFPLTDS